jgi:ATP-dependent DNA helicase RecQ
VKAKKYGQTFLDLIGDYCREHDIKEMPKQRAISASSYPSSTTKPRHIVVGEAFNAGKSVKELKTEYGVKLSTILKHLHKYAVAGNSLRATDEFLEFSELSSEQQTTVLNTFDRLGTDRLRPIFDALNEEISYDELHVLRLYYLGKNSGE